MKNTPVIESISNVLDIIDKIGNCMNKSKYAIPIIKYINDRCKDFTIIPPNRDSHY